MPEIAGQKVDQRVQKTRHRVLAAAQRLLRESGPQALTYSALAEASGVGRATLYRHWPTIDDLWTEVAADVVPSLRFVPSGDLRADLAASLDLSAEVASDDSGRANFVNLLQRSQWDDESLEFIRSFNHLTPVHVAIQHAIDIGELPGSYDAATETALLLGPLVLMSLTNRGDFGPDLISTIVDRYMEATRERP